MERVQKASRSLESPPTHSYHLFLIVRLAVEKKKRETTTNTGERKIYRLQVHPARPVSMDALRRTRTRTTTRTSTNRRPPTEIFSSFYSRLRPFTSPDRFSRGLNTGMHRQRPGICVCTSHVYPHIHTHTHMRSPHISCRRKAYNDFLFRTRKAGRPRVSDEKNFILTIISEIIIKYSLTIM